MFKAKVKNELCVNNSMEDPRPPGTYNNQELTARGAWTSPLQNKARTETFRHRSSDRVSLFFQGPKALHSLHVSSDRSQATHADRSPRPPVSSTWLLPLLPALSGSWLLGFDIPGSTHHVLGFYSCTNHYIFDFKNKAVMQWNIIQP